MINNEWINCDDRMPENGQELLMTYNNFVMEGRFLEDKFYYRDCGTYEEQEGITHWMQLPSRESIVE